METQELLCHAVPKFCQLTKELGDALTSDEIYADYGTPKPWKARQNSSYSKIVKWISPTRFVVKEEVQFQVKDRTALDKYGEVEKLDPETYGRSMFMMLCSTPKASAAQVRWCRGPTGFG